MRTTVLHKVYVYRSQNRVGGEKRVKKGEEGEGKGSHPGKANGRKAAELVRLQLDSFQRKKERKKGLPLPPTSRKTKLAFFPSPFLFLD